MIRCSRPSLVAILATSVLLAGGTFAQGDSWAIVVGVNEYPNVKLSDGSATPPLRGAEADADAVANVLIERFEFPKSHVKLLKGADATRAKLQSAFQDVTRQAMPDDVFVFHYSGHGTRVPDRRPFDEPDKLDEVLCLADTNGDGENLLIDDDLGLWLEDLPAGRVSVILDCCHAGTGTKDPDDDLVPRFLPLNLASAPIQPAKKSWGELRNTTKSGPRRMTAFFACHADQQAYERRFPDVKAPAKGGQFTQALLAGLRDTAADADKDGKITNQELFRFAAKRLDQTFNKTRTHQSERQEPLLETEDVEAEIFGRSVQ